MKIIEDQRWATRKPRMWFVAIFCFALQLNAANMVTSWNTIASTTIVANGGKAAAASGVWFAYTSLAVYDAVNAITGEYRPFYYQGCGSRGRLPGSCGGRRCAPRTGELLPNATDGAG